MVLATYATVDQLMVLDMKDLIVQTVLRGTYSTGNFWWLRHVRDLAERDLLGTKLGNIILKLVAARTRQSEDERRWKTEIPSYDRASPTSLVALESYPQAMSQLLQAILTEGRQPWSISDDGWCAFHEHDRQQRCPFNHKIEEYFF